MGVLITSSLNRHPENLKVIRKKAQEVLNVLESPDGELSISIVGDLEIAKLNKKYLNRDGPTNVIAFPMQEGDFSTINSNLLGDVVISIDTAKKEAELAEITTKERFYQLLVHGILHLFGYDHGESEEALIMEKKSENILVMLRIGDEINSRS